jgi:hypothetical protein
MSKYERDIEKASVTAAKLTGWYGIKLLTTLVKGLPDRMFIGYGKVVFIEYKNADGVLSPMQRRVHAIFAQYGHQVHVARSVDETIKILKGKIENVK